MYTIMELVEGKELQDLVYTNGAYKGITFTIC
jgi:hypothetical protein